MAIIETQGKLFIDLVDVYQWLEATGTATEGTRALAFSVERDALVLSFNDGREVEVPAEDLWTWVLDKQLPRGFAGFETVFGVPAVRGDDGYSLEISFAASNDCDPRTWSPAPACLAEWEARKNG